MIRNKGCMDIACAASIWRPRVELRAHRPSIWEGGRWIDQRNKFRSECIYKNQTNFQIQVRSEVFNILQFGRVPGSFGGQEGRKFGPKVRESWKTFTKKLWKTLRRFSSHGKCGRPQADRRCSVDRIKYYVPFHKIWLLLNIKTIISNFKLLSMNFIYDLHRTMIRRSWSWCTRVFHQWDHQSILSMPS